MENVTTCHILILEDSPADAELLERRLRSNGINFSFRMVSSKEDFIAALENRNEPPDIILADYVIPSFTGFEALRLAKLSYPETPFIFVSGTFGEETAVESVKNGATDYVLKDRLSRLPVAISRALREVGEKRRLKEIEDERNKAVLELIEADRAKDEFIALLSHELRNPLMSLLVSAELLAEKVKSSEKKKILETIHHDTHHLARLLDDLLDVARVTQGKIRLKKARVHLENVIEKALNMIRTTTDAKTRVITADIEPMEIFADPVRLEQIVINIMNNAVKYTEPEDGIHITARRDGERVLISVRDTGIGIAPKLLPKIFDLFTRADKDPAHTEGGLGVGLTIVKKLTELHGGEVRAASEGLGMGSEFTVTLPLAGENAEKNIEENTEEATPEERAAASAEKKDEKKDSKPIGGSNDSRYKKILVVDDNRGLADAIGSALRRLGASVYLAYNGKEALALAERFHPEMVLLDIGLPITDGFAVGKAIREKFGNSMKLVALSGYGQEKDKLRAFEAGFDAYIVKPVGINELKDILFQ